MEIRFGQQQNEIEKEAAAFAKTHGEQLKALSKTCDETCWELYTQGGADGRLEAFQEAEMKHLEYKKNPDYFQKASTFHDSPEINNPQLKRQIEILYNIFRQGSMSPEIQKTLIQKGAETEALYNGFRTSIDGKVMGNQEIKKRFKDSTDPAEAQKLWEAQQTIGTYRGEENKGPSVAERIVELANTRNQMAQKNGFSDYYSMSLHFQDIDEQKLVTIMNQLKTATDQPYAQLMNQLDGVARERFKLPSTKSTRLPWFQAESNRETLFNFRADDYLEGKDPVPLVEKAANLMGNSVQWLIDKSSLYYEPDNKGKSQHWALFPIDTNDVRVLANIDKGFKNNMAYALDVLFHEALGHGLDFSQMDPNLPEVFQKLHTITTEASAMLHQDLMTSEAMFREVVGLDAEESKTVAKKAQAYAAVDKLSRIRTMLTIIDFERSLYKTLANKPDTSLQGINDLWWQKQEKYRSLKRPPGQENQADWTQVPHYAFAPVYFQNYLLADIQRAQVLSHINETFRPGQPPNSDCLLTPEAGEFLKEHRAKGATDPWAQIAQNITGNPLDPTALVKEMWKGE